MKSTKLSSRPEFTKKDIYHKRTGYVCTVKGDVFTPKSDIKGSVAHLERRLNIVISYIDTVTKKCNDLTNGLSGVKGFIKDEIEPKINEIIDLANKRSDVIEDLMSQTQHPPK